MIERHESNDFAFVDDLNQVSVYRELVVKVHSEYSMKDSHIHVITRGSNNQNSDQYEEKK